MHLRLARAMVVLHHVARLARPLPTHPGALSTVRWHARPLAASTNFGSDGAQRFLHLERGQQHQQQQGSQQHQYKEQTHGEPKSLIPRVKMWAQVFMNGCTHVWHDVKSTRALRKRLKQGTAITALTGRERRLLRQTPEDVALAVPLVLLFAVPILGYAAPLVGLAFPRLLLPPQFWSEQQHRIFVQQAASELRQKGQPRVLELLRRRAQSGVSTHPSFGGVSLHGDAVKAGMAPRDVAALRGAFIGRGPADLAFLEREHLVELLRAKAAVPWQRRALVRALPGMDVLRWVLERHAHAIREDDMDLRADGLDKLSSKELLRACYLRQLSLDLPPLGEDSSAAGVYDRAVVAAAARKALSTWLSLSEPYEHASGGGGKAEEAPVEAEEVPAQERRRTLRPRQLPDSLLLHAPMMLQSAAGAPARAPAGAAAKK